MSDANLIPISDEQAKLGQEIVKAGHDVFGTLRDVLGDLPKDLVGLLVGDKVKVWRAERLAMLWGRAKKHLEEQRVTDPEPPSLKLALPILAAAADESHEELQDLWVRLLAAAMTPGTAKQVRLSFIEAVKKLDPLDALVLVQLKQGNGGVTQGGSNNMASSLGVSRDEIDVSLMNLVSVGFAANVPNSVVMTPFGREFLRTIQY